MYTDVRRYLVGASAGRVAQTVDGRGAAPQVRARHRGRLIVGVARRRFRTPAFVATIIGEPVLASVTATAYWRAAVCDRLFFNRYYCRRCNEKTNNISAQAQFM